VATDVEKRIRSYRASIERLKRVNAELRVERGRMKWVAIATLVAFVVTFFAISHTVGVFVVLVGGSAFLVGPYVVYMHMHENRLTIKSAKETIASIDKESNARSKTT
jgi:hypothetical protein